MRFVLEDDIESQYGIRFSKRHRRRLIAAGKHPRPVMISPRRTAFVEAEMDEYAARIVAERDGKAA